MRKADFIQKTALKNSFQKAGLCPSYPFNVYEEQYSEEVYTCTVYQNPERLAWIAKQLSKGKSHAPHNL